MLQVQLGLDGTLSQATLSREKARSGYHLADLSFLTFTEAQEQPRLPHTGGLSQLGHVAERGWGARFWPVEYKHEGKAFAPHDGDRRQPLLLHLDNEHRSHNIGLALEHAQCRSQRGHGPSGPGPG